MQSFGALIAVAALAVAGASGPHHRTEAALPAADEAEVYVAELDADWNVAREIRVPCDIDRGCALDLALSDTTAGHLHVRFDPVRRGKVDVESSIDDPAGHAVAQPAVSLALDQTGFGATHVDRDAAQPAAATAAPKRVFMMAVKVPGFMAPSSRALPVSGEAI